MKFLSHTAPICGRAIGLALVLSGTILADPKLYPSAPTLDRPTLVALGIQLPVTGDDNFNASVTVQYCVQSTNDCKTGLPLYRVHPEVVAGYNVTPQFAGSIFNLKPATTYVITLTVTDPDGIVGLASFTLTGTTRPVPGDPATPRNVNVATAATLTSALGAAQPGDIITLANGTYSGAFVLNASGTADKPIVIRGSSEEGTIIDGKNCKRCNVLEVYGSYVHIENLRIQNGQRALRFFNATTGNVVRRVHIANTILGIGAAQNDQTDFYIADNILEGRLLWPKVYSSDRGRHSNDDGIRVTGRGHVIAHNTISGYGDAMKVEQPGARAVDFYGNDILWTYDNGIELDESEGNVRCFSNRFTNTYATISTQPVYGGPAYIFRNIVLNVVNEQLKFHPLNGTEPSGMLVYHNTFISPKQELSQQTGATSHYFSVVNNLFVGPTPLGSGSNGYAVDWGGPMDHPTFDYNGYSPDGYFGFMYNGVYTTFPNFAGLQAANWIELNGILLVAPACPNGVSPFTGCVVPPASYTTFMQPPQVADLVPVSASGALDPAKVMMLPNINTTPSGGVDLLYSGTKPELGAVESGCTYTPTFGPRPAGVDETTEHLTCR